MLARAWKSVYSLEEGRKAQKAGNRQMHHDYDTARRGRKE